ncbi:MAG: ATP-binding protein [Gammaproteobacteria bacterium]|nr:ATP-binding protein [Gammaproteobacteria bacterium]
MYNGTLADKVIAAALIGRPVTHHCHIVNIPGNSYRVREHDDLLRSGVGRHLRGNPA